MCAEEQFLQECIQVFLSAGDPGETEFKSTAVLDWPRFLALAEEHSLAPLVAWTLKARESLVPDSVLRECRAQYRHNVKRSMVLAEELKRVVTALEAAGIEVLLLKGLALAYWLYPDPGLRVFDDLDLLVSRPDLPEARRILSLAGYRAAGDEPFRRVQDAFLHWFSELHLVHNESGINIDLHWDLLPPFCPARGAPPGYRLRSQVVMVDGFPIRTLSPRDYQIHLNTHGGLHRWSSLKWLVDLERLRQAFPPSDDARSIPSSRAARIIHWFYLALIPRPTDFLSLALPPPLYFLYFPWRWTRLTAKYLGLSATAGKESAKLR